MFEIITFNQIDWTKYNNFCLNNGLPAPTKKLDSIGYTFSQTGAWERCHEDKGRTPRLSVVCVALCSEHIIIALSNRFVFPVIIERRSDGRFYIEFSAGLDQLTDFAKEFGCASGAAEEFRQISLAIYDKLNIFYHEAFKDYRRTTQDNTAFLRKRN